MSRGTDHEDDRGVATEYINLWPYTQNVSKPIIFGQTKTRKYVASHICNLRPQILALSDLGPHHCDGSAQLPPANVQRIRAERCRYGGQSSRSGRRQCWTKCRAASHVDLGNEFGHAQPAHQPSALQHATGAQRRLLGRGRFHVRVEWAVMEQWHVVGGAVASSWWVAGRHFFGGR